MKAQLPSIAQYFVLGSVDA